MYVKYMETGGGDGSATTGLEASKYLIFAIITAKDNNSSTYTFHTYNGYWYTNCTYGTVYIFYTDRP